VESFDLSNLLVAFTVYSFFLSRTRAYARHLCTRSAEDLSDEAQGRRSARQLARAVAALFSVD
jgi:hypothetical protein